MEAALREHFSEYEPRDNGHDSDPKCISGLFRNEQARAAKVLKIQEVSECNAEGSGRGSAVHHLLEYLRAVLAVASVHKDGEHCVKLVKTQLCVVAW